jgi:hypothetical protein
MTKEPDENDHANGEEKEMADAKKTENEERIRQNHPNNSSLLSHLSWVAYRTLVVGCVHSPLVLLLYIFLKRNSLLSFTGPFPPRKAVGLVQTIAAATGTNRLHHHIALAQQTTVVVINNYDDELSSIVSFGVDGTGNFAKNASVAAK